MHRKNPLAKIGTIFRFRNLATARSFAQRCNKSMAILLGNCPEYWVATPGQAKRLEALGYEILETT
jgi:hypothetical protein